MRSRSLALAALAARLLVACSDSAGASATEHTDAGASPVADAGPDANVYGDATELDVDIPATGRVYVSLGSASVATPNGDPKTSGDWDLAFEGYDVLTDSGASGAGMGGAFGPLDPSSFASDAAPTVPFLSADKAGGAFLDWYAYDGSTHVLYSRFHVYGVKSGARIWKLQLLTYYGVVDNAPTSALYQLRYAELTNGVSATQTLNVDGTAGGLAAPASAPSACLDLASGAVTSLVVADALQSTAWDLCFRRDSISVNGEVGGPRGDGAVDLEASQTETEELADVMAKTADGEQSLFEDVTSSSFANSTFRGDHVVSAFESGGWLATQTSPPSPTGQAWLVVDASGAHKFLVAFSAFRGSTTSSPGTVVMHIKPVSG